MIAELFLACALALPAVSSDGLELQEVDITFFKCLSAMVPEYELLPGEEKYKIVVVQEKLYFWSDLTKYTYQVVPGGFLIMETRNSFLHMWLKSRGWELLPMYWHNKAIYRRWNGDVAA